MDSYLDVYHESLVKRGEELCGDTVRIVTRPDRAIAVLSDGLGSGVKANILATMTASIIATMLKASAPLQAVMQTVLESLPVDRVRKTSYATFTILDVDRTTSRFRVTNFDNPPVFYFKRGKVTPLEESTEQVLGRRVVIAEGWLERGDFLGAVSDGVLHAGVGVQLNFGWGWKNVAKHVERVFITYPGSARSVVRSVIAQTDTLYRGEPGDDATFVGLYARSKSRLIVFTGPPLDKSSDSRYVEQLLDFEGRKVVCGGTTGTIVADYLGRVVVPDLATMRESVPPIGKLREVDLLTEGILTMSRALELLKEAHGDPSRLPQDRNGAVLLVRELLQADAIHFLLGQSINEYYQNPLLPKNVSIRRNLVESIAHILRQVNKEVTVEYC